MFYFIVLREVIFKMSFIGRMFIVGFEGYGNLDGISYRKVWRRKVRSV